MRQIAMLSQILGRVLLQKSSAATTDIIDARGHLASDKYLAYQLQKGISQGRINEAENLLFEVIEQDKSAANLQAALDFYERLDALSDETLQARGFSREEIMEGLAAVHKHYTTR